MGKSWGGERMASAGMDWGEMGATGQGVGCRERAEKAGRDWGASGAAGKELWGIVTH